MNTPAMLKLAWQLATGAITHADHVAHAHTLVSHPDGSSCDGGATCGLDRDGLLAYELAHEVAGMTGARFVDFVAAWLTRDTVVNSEAAS